MKKKKKIKPINPYSYSNIVSFHISRTTAIFILIFIIMNINGIIIGAAVFLSIGICHPLVIKMEYHWGKQSWWIWLVAGLAFCLLSLLVENDILSIIIGGFAFCCLWGIHEMFLQEKRVLRGWFPENPKRHEYYQSRRKEMEGKL